MPPTASTTNIPAATSSLVLPQEIKDLIFNELLALKDRVVDLGDDKNLDGFCNSNIFKSLSRTNKTFYDGFKCWFKARNNLLRGPSVTCGIFDPRTTVFLIDLTFLARNRDIGSFIMGGDRPLRDCTDQTWLQINSAWSNRTLLENAQNIRIDVAHLSRMYKCDPALILFSLFWHHFERPPRLQSIDIILDVSQSACKYWMSSILADIWVWLGLCSWSFERCRCPAPRNCRPPTIRYQDTGSGKKSRTWLPLKIECRLEVEPFFRKCSKRERHTSRRLSEIIRSNKKLDSRLETW
ncbi:hypothetical protein F5882DRAFT_372983 [Hyaloscypha sp. PMI_1271]|nr:hypothetical protein F5882DRAFT_372983 [Hyaloscypha sp. PMI_1271]